MGMTTVETDIYQCYLKMSQGLYLVLGRAKEGEIGNNNFTFTDNCNFVYFNVTIAPVKQELWISFVYYDINFIILNNGKQSCSLVCFTLCQMIDVIAFVIGCLLCWHFLNITIDHDHRQSLEKNKYFHWFTGILNVWPLLYFPLFCFTNIFSFIKGF